MNWKSTVSTTHWHKQNPEQPLFDEIIWQKPENPRSHPKILIVGGTAHGFSATASLYQQIWSQAKSNCKVVLPSVLEKLTTNVLPNVNYVDSTSTGEVSGKALEEIRSYTNWANMLVVCSDIGNNSETEALINKLVGKIEIPIVFWGSAVSLVANQAASLADTSNIILVAEQKYLVSFISKSNASEAFTSNLGLVRAVELASIVTQDWKLSFATKIDESILSANLGRVATTKHSGDWEASYIANLASLASFYQSKPFEVMASAAV